MREFDIEKTDSKAILHSTKAVVKSYSTVSFRCQWGQPRGGSNPLIRTATEIGSQR